VSSFVPDLGESHEGYQFYERKNLLNGNFENSTFLHQPKAPPIKNSLMYTFDIHNITEFQRRMSKIGSRITFLQHGYIEDHLSKSVKITDSIGILNKFKLGILNFRIIIVERPCLKNRLSQVTSELLFFRYVGDYRFRRSPFSWLSQNQSVYYNEYRTSKVMAR
jgi:hypothetical protein